MAALDPYQGNLTGREAAHLLRRTTFGPSYQAIDEFTGMPAAQAVDQLLDQLYWDQDLVDLKPPIDPAIGDTWIQNPEYAGDTGENARKNIVLKWWVGRMLNGSTHALEKTVYFLHTHIPTLISRVPQSEAVYNQLWLFRRFAFGDYRQLMKLICYDNAMLRNLDGNLNEVGRPNENFAREFLELYTTGKGPQISADNYTRFTESDVIEAAKVLSGFDYDRNFDQPDPETGIPMGKIKGNGRIATRHDVSTKNFSEAFNNTVIVSPPEFMEGERLTHEGLFAELDQFVNMVFDHPETAKNFCRKLYRFFVNYRLPDIDIDPEHPIEQNVITPLADAFIESEFNIHSVLHLLLSSQHFFDADNTLISDNHRGAVIKSPLDLTLGTFRFFSISAPNPETEPEAYYNDFASWLVRKIDAQGLNLYEPYDVAGYEAYFQAPGYHRNWITVNNLATRYLLKTEIWPDNDDPRKFSWDIYQFVLENIVDPGASETTPEQIVRPLVNTLLPEEVSEDRMNQFIQLVPLLNREDREIVHMELQDLMMAIIQSPEYQLS